MIQELFTKFKGFIVGLIVDFLVKLVNGLIPDEDVKSAGTKAGRFITDECRDALGFDWETAESMFETKMGMFISGFYAGLDYDDKEK